jgi:hypothetical protein
MITHIVTPRGWLLRPDRLFLRVYVKKIITMEFFDIGPTIGREEEKAIALLASRVARDRSGQIALSPLARDGDITIRTPMRFHHTP